MAERFASIWFPYLLTDWFTIRHPVLRGIPFVLAAPDHGRMIITAVSRLAQQQHIETGITVADARVTLPSLHVFDDKPGLGAKLLEGLAEWCIRYTPVVGIDAPDGLLLNVTGCAHLWGGEEQYLTEIDTRLTNLGYNASIAMADTVGTAWALSRFGTTTIAEPGTQATALLELPPHSLRIEAAIAERLGKLGLKQIRDFINMPRAVLRRRFGKQLIERLDQALGNEEEIIQPVQPVEPYQERLPCLEPIVTATGIEIAVQRLLDALCMRLKQEQKGLRKAVLKCYRIDGKIETVEIGTNRASHKSNHLFKLFEIKLPGIEPALGIELFMLEAQKVEDVAPMQEKLWETSCGLDNINLAELLDRLAGRIGSESIHRYVPAEHFWPERSMKRASSLEEKSTTAWKTDRPRPLQLLPNPEPILVTAPVPDYPPMSFRYKGKLHKVIRADGPERIEQEWWLQQGQHRDYYNVEDENGCRYWLFRSGHYSGEKNHQWFIHGFFA
jgi:protein ImuB